MNNKFGRVIISCILKKNTLCICLMTVVFFLVSCGRTASQNSPGLAETYQDFGNVIVLGVVNDSEPTISGLIHMDTVTDNLHVQFANLTQKEHEYILKLFLDYQETDFYLNEQKHNGYVFSAAAGEELDLVVNLDTDASMDESHILTAAVLTAPDTHAKDLDFISNSYGIVMNYELAPAEGERRINPTQACREPDVYLELEYQGIMLNQDYETEGNSVVYLPPSNITVQPNETVSLAYRAGNYEKADDILILLLLDWKQQQVNGSPFEYVKNIPGLMSYGTLEFTAPSEPGFYEVTAFVSEQPYELRNRETFHTSDTSYRFTLTVE